MSSDAATSITTAISNLGLSSIISGYIPSSSALNNTASYVSLLRSGTWDLVVLLFCIALILLFLIMVKWLFSKEEFLVLPFETSGKDNEFNGQAIADHLVYELSRIKRIHSQKFECHPAIERLPLPPETVSCEKLEGAIDDLIASSQSISQSVSNVGSVSVSGTSLPLGEFLITIKNFINRRRGREFISGSLQKFDKNYSIVAHVYHKGHVHSCEAGKEDGETDIQHMIRNLAYKIYFDLSSEELALRDRPPVIREELYGHRVERMRPRPRNVPPGLIMPVADILDPNDKWNRRLNKEELILKERFGVLPLLIDRDKFKSNHLSPQSPNSLQASSWRSLEYLTEALYHYDEYIKTEKKENLKRAGDYCNKAFDEQKDYEILFGLFYNIGIAYFDIDDNETSLNLFRSANRIKSHAGALCGQGLNLRYQQKFDEALGVFHKAMYEDPDLAIPWAGIAATYMDLGCYAYDLYYRSLAGFNEAIKRYPDYPYAWMYMGIVLERMGVLKKIANKYNLSDESIKLFDSAIQCLKHSNHLARQQGSKRFSFNALELASCYKWKEDDARANEVLSILNIEYLRSKYNQACAKSLMGEKGEALKLAKEALAEGKMTKVELLFDPDFYFGMKDLIEDLKKIEQSSEAKKVVESVISNEDLYVRASFKAVTAVGEIEKIEACELLKRAINMDLNNFERAKRDPHFWVDKKFLSKIKPRT